MERPCAGQVAAVTGAGSGIGRAMAVAFAVAGARVVVADWEAEALEETRGLVECHGEVRAVEADVRREEDVTAIVGEAVRVFGRLTTMCNNAGVLSCGTVEEVTVEEFDRVMAVNVRGVFLGCKHAVPALRAAGGGTIINTASANSIVAEPKVVAYCASKGAVLMLTKAVAVDCARENIRVNCICPGLVDTPMARAQHAEDEQIGDVSRFQPIGRLGRPEEIAAVAVFLASSGASFITGSALSVDGGVTAI